MEDASVAELIDVLVEPRHEPRVSLRGLYSLVPQTGSPVEEPWNLEPPKGTCRALERDWKLVKNGGFPPLRP